MCLVPSGKKSAGALCCSVNNELAESAKLVQFALPKTQSTSVIRLNFAMKNTKLKSIGCYPEFCPPNVQMNFRYFETTAFENVELETIRSYVPLRVLDTHAPSFAAHSLVTVYVGRLLAFRNTFAIDCSVSHSGGSQDH